MTIISLAATITLPIRAQMVRLYTMQQGLPTTHVSASYVDDDGLLWLMGERMLSFFDGNQFHKVFDGNSDIAKRTNIVYSMVQIDKHCYLLGTGFGLYHFNSHTNKFTQVSLNEPKTENSLPGYPVSSILLLTDGRHALVTTSGFGAFVIDTATFDINVPMISEFSKAVEDRFVYTAYTDSQGRLWVSTSTEPLVMLDERTLEAHPIDIEPSLHSKIMGNACPIVCICEDRATHNVLLGALGMGLLVYDDATNTVRETRGRQGDLAPRAIIHTKGGNIYVGTDNAGIVQYDRREEATSPVKWVSPGVDLAVSKVHHLNQDIDGNLIATLYQNGVLIAPEHVNKMTYMPVSRSDNGINSSPVSCLFYKDGVAWVGTDGSGVFKASNTVPSTMESASAGLNLQQMMCVTADANGTAWAASYGGGVQCYDGERWTTPQYVAELSSQAVMWIEPDLKTNRLYVCINGDGLYEVDINAQTTRKMEWEEIGNRWVSFAKIDFKRNLWVVFATGLCRYNLDTHEVRRMDLSNIANTQINDMAVMGTKVYFGTNNGLASYTYKADEIVYEKAVNERLAERNIKSLQPVGKDLWIGMSQAVACLSASHSPKGGDWAGWHSPPLGSWGAAYLGELNQRSRLCIDGEHVCFGGDNGIIAISTHDVCKKEHSGIDTLLFTGLTVDEQPVIYDPETDHNVLAQSILAVDKITLPHDQNAFAISFGSTMYAHADEIEYLYMLEGHEDVWHTANSSNAVARYTSVPSGHYTLRVKAHFNHNDQWTERTIDIEIRHPWYATCWAIAVYALLALLLALLFYKLIADRQRERAAVRKLQQNEQMKEAKLRLFTSIAHELRTPLTMIVSPLKQLKTNDEDDGRKALYDVMQRNCDRLLNIVKQITDVRKIDNGQLRLHFSEFDFVEYCDGIMDSFSGAAAAKNLNAQHFANEPSVMVWADKVHLEKVIINLLSNAYKFTPANGQVLVRTEVKDNSDGTFTDRGIEQYLECSVYNSGTHIDEQDMEHIYERFYQGKAESEVAGSGIGLNLSYELMKLHHGLISAKNAEPDGVEFTLKLPLGKAHLTKEELKPRDTESASQTEQQSNQSQITTLESSITTEQSLENQDAEDTKSKKTLLIVDDDREMCEYMRSQLEADYNVMVCFSGNTAWKQVLAVRPDVVITDLVMADGDGIELCQNIKRNHETAHIPVIMLTAESDEQSHLRSMSVEVDRFLAKPFNIDLVKGALSQALLVRESLLNKANRAEIQYDYEEIEMNSYEAKLFAKVNEAIKRNLDDSGFTVEALSKEVGISRVHLNRKLKERYGLSPNAYIRSVRLKQAAYLLVNHKVNISEVAYKVGFASHSYFSNNFHEYFGKTPTDFVNYYSLPENEEQLKKLLE